MKRVVAVACVVALASLSRAFAADGPPEVVVDIPVKLESAKVVLNLDHLAFAGDEPVGLEYAHHLLDVFEADGTKAEIVAIFHGEAGYMLLDDQKYDAVRNWKGGNPYREQVLAAIARGISIEECGETMRDAGWGNADLLPGVKVNTGANFRIIQLVQDGFVQIQP
ncbi:MAG: DsrE family protein [Rhizobiales bacterium]|nr:DsrE family protein [Hyphomicrobiales bacterium]